jgi:hypothetical protein
VPAATTTVPPAPGALLAGAIDYAGLFPPAGLEMPAAVGNFLAYRAGPDAWALGRFVVPVAWLAELELALRRCAARRMGRVPLSALVGPGTADEVDAIEVFNRRAPEHGARIGAVEVKAGSAGVVRAVLAALPRSWIRYIEVPVGDDPDAVAVALDAIVAGGAFAKVRTGGTVPDAIPPPGRLAAFLAALALRNLPFKATAGLHHPIRGEYPLGYEPGAPTGVMYGYLNLMLAAAVLHAGFGEDRARAALAEDDPGALRLDADALHWKDAHFGPAELATMRDAFFHGFGSCSFREPLDQLLRPPRRR